MNVFPSEGLKSVFSSTPTENKGGEGRSENIILSRKRRIGVPHRYCILAQGPLQAVARPGLGKSKNFGVNSPVIVWPIANMNLSQDMGIQAGSP